MRSDNTSISTICGGVRVIGMVIVRFDVNIKQAFENPALLVDDIIQSVGVNLDGVNISVDINAR